MISGLSAQILGHIEKHPGGVKLVELQSEFRRPPQEIEAAVSQLKRQNYIQQSQLWIWMACGAGSVRADREPQHARIVPAAPSRSALGATTDHPVVPCIAAALCVPSAELSNDLKQAKYSSEQPMSKAAKKCNKCGARKGATAYHAGSDTCRACQAGRTTSKSKPNSPPDQKLKEIIERQRERVAAINEGDAIEAAIAALESRRHKIDEAISTLRALG